MIDVVCISCGFCSGCFCCIGFCRWFGFSWSCFSCTGCCCSGCFNGCCCCCSDNWCSDCWWCWCACCCVIAELMYDFIFPRHMLQPNPVTAGSRWNFSIAANLMSAGTEAVKRWSYDNNHWASDSRFPLHSPILQTLYRRERCVTFSFTWKMESSNWFYCVPDSWPNSRTPQNVIKSCNIRLPLFQGV